MAIFSSLKSEMGSIHGRTSYLSFLWVIIVTIKIIFEFSLLMRTQRFVETLVARIFDLEFYGL